MKNFIKFYFHTFNFFSLNFDFIIKEIIQFQGSYSPVPLKSFLSTWFKRKVFLHKKNIIGVLNVPKHNFCLKSKVKKPFTIQKQITGNWRIWNTVKRRKVSHLEMKISSFKDPYLESCKFCVKICFINNHSFLTIFMS